MRGPSEHGEEATAVDRARVELEQQSAARQGSMRDRGVGSVDGGVVRRVPMVPSMWERWKRT